MQSMEVGQLGRAGKIVTLHATTLVGRFVSVIATILDLHTMAKTVEKTTVNMKLVQSTVVVRLFTFFINLKLFCRRDAYRLHANGVMSLKDILRISPGKLYDLDETWQRDGELGKSDPI